MTDLSNAEIKKTLGEFEISSSNELCNLIRVYISLLLRWNERISLTTVTSPTEILRFHFGESVFGASVAAIHRGRLCDVGSGAGFPGLALRLVRPDLELVLIEANTKKSAFLWEVVRELHLNRVQVFRGRMRELPGQACGLDFVTARAVGQHIRTLNWARSRINDVGKAVLWLGEDDVRTVSGASGWIWQQPRRIPGSERRVILVGSPS